MTERLVRKLQLDRTGILGGAGGSRSGRRGVPDPVSQHRSGGVEQPGDGLAVLSDRRRRCEVTLDVLDGGFQDVQAIMKVVELGSGHDELVLGQTRVGGPLAAQVLLLAAGRPAELPGPPRPLPLRQPPPAPPTPR